MSAAILTQAVLKKTLLYSPSTGIFTWLNPKAYNIKAGSIAGGLDLEGYRIIRINGVQHRSHRLAWFYVTGSFPVDDIDHINGVRDDNRIENLRVVTAQENQRNQKRRQDNTSGVTGVSWCKRSNKWRSVIGNNGKNIYLGQFDILEEAIAARHLADIKYGYHPNHGRS